MIVHIFDYGDWSAIYVDGKLIHWHDTPGPGKLLDLLGIENVHEDLPNCFHKETDNMPQTIEEFTKRLLDHADTELERQITETKRKLRELEQGRRRK